MRVPISIVLGIIAVAMNACGGTPATPTPTLAVQYTAAQVQECRNAAAVLDAGSWAGYEIATSLGNENVKEERPSRLKEVKSFLNAAELLTRPPWRVRNGLLQSPR